ncbi:hypothetical protein KEM55_000284 [Ascosphaera atra]|nr:hypothetical protein KEM55_000284 [Ascosphaera atra]
MFTMFRKLDDMLQECEAGRSFRNLMLQDERAAQDKEGENRLLLTRYILEYADRYAEYHPKEEKDGMLTEIAEVVQECFEGKEDDYFYPGLEPPELERCRQLHEHEQHVPQCQMS